MKIKIFSIFVILFVFSCASKKKSTAGFYNYEVECMGAEMNGSQQVKAYGTGKDKQDAIDQAKKNAVYAVIFKGVRLGRNGCSVNPLVFGANAEKENEAYFNKFFSDKSIYSTFVTSSDFPDNQKELQSGRGKEKVYFVVVTVKMGELKKELTNKGIILKSVE